MPRQHWYQELVLLPLLEFWSHFFIRMIALPLQQVYPWGFIDTSPKAVTSRPPTQVYPWWILRYILFQKETSCKSLKDVQSEPESLYSGWQEATHRSSHVSRSFGKPESYHCFEVTRLKHLVLDDLKQISLGNSGWLDAALSSGLANFCDYCCWVAIWIAHSPWLS